MVMGGETGKSLLCFYMLISRKFGIEIYEPKKGQAHKKKKTKNVRFQLT